MLESLIAQPSSTLCLLSSDLHQLLQLQNPNNNFCAQRRSYACFSESPTLCLILWLGKVGGLLPKCCTPPPKKQHFYLNWWLICKNKDNKIEGLFLISFT